MKKTRIKPAELLKLLDKHNEKILKNIMKSAPRNITIEERCEEMKKEGDLMARQTNEGKENEKNKN